ncbi:MAG: methyltransferase domain-containing protein [Actinomycetota bacterium]
MSESELSIVIPIWGADHNLTRLVPSLTGELGPSVPRPLVIVAAGPDDRDVEPLAQGLGARFVRAEGDGYGTILRAGLAAASGSYVITMDGDFSHRPGYVRTMWYQREEGDVLIASRFVRGSYPEMRFVRRVLSRLLNFLYRKILSLPYRDLSSGFRMYRRQVLEDIGEPRGRGLDVQPELLVRTYCQGWNVTEVPFWYQGARPVSRMRMLRLGIGYLRTIGRLFALRNSVKAADYDHRAFDSWIPLQRYWQRRRFKIIQDFVPTSGRVLDIGCGSSRIVQNLPRGVGMDLAIRKLRWLRSPGRMLLQGDMNHLPFRDGAFDAVVCSEVIEHVPRDEVRLSEQIRVLAPGGMLILGTPDYGRRLWRALEWTYGKVFPGGYAKEHINRYTYGGLRSELESLGLEVLDCRYVARSEMIFRARLPAEAASLSSDASARTRAHDTSTVKPSGGVIGTST